MCGEERRCRLALSLSALLFISALATLTLAADYRKFVSSIKEWDSTGGKPSGIDQWNTGDASPSSSGVYGPKPLGYGGRVVLAAGPAAGCSGIYSGQLSPLGTVDVRSASWDVKVKVLFIDTSTGLGTWKTVKTWKGSSSTSSPVVFKAVKEVALYDFRTASYTAPSSGDYPAKVKVEYSLSANVHFEGQNIVLKGGAGLDISITKGRVKQLAVLKVKARTTGGSSISVTISYSGTYSGSRATPFTLYGVGKDLSITLTAPATSSGYEFDHWEVGASTYSSRTITVKVPVGSSKTAVAVYKGGGGSPPPPPPSNKPADLYVEAWSTDGWRVIAPVRGTYGSRSQAGNSIEAYTVYVKLHVDEGPLGYSLSASTPAYRAYRAWGSGTYITTRNNVTLFGPWGKRTVAKVSEPLRGDYTVFISGGYKYCVVKLQVQQGGKWATLWSASGSGRVERQVQVSLNGQRLRLYYSSSSWIGRASIWVAVARPDPSLKPLRWEVYNSSGNPVLSSGSAGVSGWVPGGEAYTARAIYQSSYTLTIRVYRVDYAGSALGPAPGKTVVVDGSTYRADARGVIQLTLPGGAHTLRVPIQVFNEGWGRYSFWRWGDGSTANPRVVDLDGDLVLTCYVWDERLLRVTWEPGEGGYVRVEGSRVGNGWSGWYAYGRSVTLEAVPSSGYVFAEWGRGVNGGAPSSYSASNPLAVTVDDGYWLEAVFKPAAGVKVVPGGGWAFYLPGEGVWTPLYDEGYGMAGEWSITVEPAYPGVEPLVAHLYNPDTGEAAYAPLASLRVSMPYNWSEVKGLCTRRVRAGEVLELNESTLQYLPRVVGPAEYGGWVFLGLVAWDPLKRGYADGFLANGTTVAVYNVTFTWRSETHVIRVFRPVVVSTLKLRLLAFYDREGAAIVWAASYAYLPPPPLASAWNLTLEPPHQDLYFTLENGSRMILTAPAGGGSYGGARGVELWASTRVGHDDLLELLHGRYAVLTARVRWMYPQGGVGECVYGAGNLTVEFVPLTLTVLDLGESPLRLKLRVDLWLDAYRGVELSSPPGGRWSWLCRVDVLVYNESWSRMFEDVGALVGGPPSPVYEVSLGVDAGWPTRFNVYGLPLAPVSLYSELKPLVGDAARYASEDVVFCVIAPRL